MAFLVKRLKIVIIAMLLFFSLSNTAFAKVVGFVGEGSDGEYYEYEYKELLDSYVSHVLGSAAPLYADYANKPVKAFLDDTNSYIDYEDVLNAYVKAVLQGKSFDPNAYTSGSAAKKAPMPNKIFTVTLGSDGKLVFTEKYLDPNLQALEEINSAGTTGEMITALEKHALTLELDLTDYHKLSPHCKNSVAGHVIGQKPAEGYEAKEAIKAVFDAGVAAATAVLEEAVTAINNAASKDEMKTALCGKAQILGLSLTQYDSLSEENKNLVAEIVLAAKPYSTYTDVRTAFNEAVNQALGKSINISYTDYNYTLQDMVAIQMGRSPQTDLYGGGWKDAKEEDVAYFVNPLNFYDPNYDGTSKDAIVINTDTLRLRERPSTASTTLANVYQNELYVILAEAEAEPDTEPGTEGTWYKITAYGKTGWVCGQYITLTTSSLPSTMYQFLLLSGSSGVSLQELGNILKGKGILDGKEEAFMLGAQDNNINEIFLTSLALHETGNGTSKLATGIEFPDVDNLFPDQDTVIVYNMFGIGAVDANPNYKGAEYAYNQRWFSPEEAIIGGAKFASEAYINHPTYKQDTLYKMRWNPGNPGKHQYATDIGWAVKQVPRIECLYNEINSCILRFDIPRYLE